MAQKENPHKITDLLADCKTDAVITFGGGELCGFIVTPMCFIPIGKELGVHIQLKNWKPQTILYQ